MGAQGTATISFGATPVYEGTIVVTGQAGIVVGSHAEAFIMADDTASGNTTNDHDFAAVSLRLTCITIVAGTGFTIKASAIAGKVTGDIKVRWVWN